MFCIFWISVVSFVELGIYIYLPGLRELKQMYSWSLVVLNSFILWSIELGMGEVEVGEAWKRQGC